MRGRQEAAAELQASLGKVASQVYDNVNAQLESIDEMHMTAAKKAVSVILRTTYLCNLRRRKS